MNELNLLIKKFLTHYTFNNAIILLTDRKILSLEKEDLIEKLINKRRGGYCFENNQYFFNYLKDQGYEVNRYLGRVVYGNGNDVPRTHQITIVSIDGEKQLVDVGFGPYTPGVAVALNGDEVEAFNGNRYRLIKLNEFDYQLETLRDGEYLSLYQFNLMEYQNADFKISNYYTNTHDDSKFTSSLVISQIETTGVKFINNLLYSEILSGNRLDIKLDTPEKFIQIINQKFNVSYSNDELIELFKKVSHLNKV